MTELIDGCAQIVTAVRESNQGRSDYVGKGRDGAFGRYLVTCVPQDSDDSSALPTFVAVILDTDGVDSGRQKSIVYERLIGILAHELRNPLGVMKSALKVLNSAPSDEHAEDARKVMGRQLRYMIELVSELFDSAHINQGTFSVRKAPISIAEVVSRAIELSNVSISRKGHSLRTSLPNYPVVVNGDRNRLTQVISNLLDNAAKYTPEGGVVSLEVSCSSSEVIIRVSDNGIGIAPEEIERIFNLFGRVGDSGRPHVKGLGIGLFLVKTILEEHNGRIIAESDGLGMGSTFSVYLPLN